MVKARFISAAYCALFSLLLLICCCSKHKNKTVTEDAEFVIDTIASGITVPFGMAFINDQTMLITDRPKGEILLLDIQTGEIKKVKGLPQVFCKGDGGMLDIMLHPDFRKNFLVYFSFSISKGADSLSTMVVERAHLKGDSLISRERLFTALPFFKDPNHFGNRMVIQNGYLFITMGERFALRDSAQLLGNHLGKVMRIRDNGDVPDDNPFVRTKGALPEIWSYGHRNPQGLTLHPVSGELWEHEHGPKGGDEVNVIKPARNYGWPVICYGKNYDDTPVGEGITTVKGMEQPSYYYVPSIAPSGMEFYTGDVFPKWKGNLFIGAMALKHLNRLVLRGEKVVHEERLLLDKKWRIRCVRQGPDGFLYLGVDGGMIVRLRN
jgi:glucose/arabinose dehydrogenase